MHTVLCQGLSTDHTALAALRTDQSSGVAPVSGQTEVAETLVTKTVRVAVLWREVGGGGLDEGKVGWGGREAGGGEREKEGLEDGKDGREGERKKWKEGEKEGLEEVKRERLEDGWWGGSGRS